MREDFDRLMALHDGEKAGEGASIQQAGSRSDSESREFLDKLAEADKAFTGAADDLLDLPVPQRLLDTIKETQPASAEIISLRRRRNLIALTIAAGLAAVVATNIQFFDSSVEPTVRPAASSYAALLQEALETVPSGDLHENSRKTIRVMPVMSFLATDDRYCREFMAQEGDTELSGLACRDSVGVWTLVHQQELNGAELDSSYRAAEESTATTPQRPPLPEVAAELGYAQEQALIHAGWDRSGL